MIKITFEVDFPPSDCRDCPLAYRDKKTYYAPYNDNSMSFAESNTIVTTICRLSRNELHSPIKAGNLSQGCKLVIDFKDEGRR